MLDTEKFPRLGPDRRGQLYVAASAVAWSATGLIQRELSVDTLTQLAGRAFFAVLVILATIAVVERGAVVQSFRSLGRSGLAGTLFMAIAGTSFILALNNTSVAHVLIINALAPLMSALLGWAALGEKVTARTWIATLIALAGVAIMIGSPGGGARIGDLFAFIMAAAFAAHVVITRHRSDISMAPAACASQLLVLLATVPFAHIAAIDPRNFGLLVALGAGAMGLPLIFLTLGARRIPPAEVALISMLETVLGPVLVWIVLSERPGDATLAGGLLVLAAICLQTLGSRRS
jgi:drug/metabolite transporter (DMT)-like permease